MTLDVYVRLEDTKNAISFELSEDSLSVLSSENVCIPIETVYKLWQSDHFINWMEEYHQQVRNSSDNTLNPS